MSLTSVAVATRRRVRTPQTTKREWWAEPAWPVYVGSFLGALVMLAVMALVGTRRTRWY